MHKIMIHVSLIMLTENLEPATLHKFAFVRFSHWWKCQVFLFCVCSRVVVCCSGIQYAKTEKWQMRKREKRKHDRQPKTITITKTNQRQNKTRKSFLRVSQIVHRLNCTLNRHHLQRASERVNKQEKERERIKHGIHAEVDACCICAMCV